MNDIQVSENFKLREFQCRHCNQVILHKELLDKLQALRSGLGVPVIVRSGYRCPTHNRAVGGAANSYHLRGMAADIVAQGKSVAEVTAEARKRFKGGGIGIYSDHVHVDIGREREWQG